MEIYKLLFAGRDQEAQRFWTAFNLMSIINGALIAVVVSQNPPQYIKILASITGLLLCFVWFSVQRRFHAWLVWWEVKLVEYEPFYLEEINQARTKNGLSNLPSTMVIFQNREGQVTRGISTRKAGWLLPLGFIVIWLFILLTSFNIQLLPAVTTPTVIPMLHPTP